MRTDKRRQKAQKHTATRHPKYTTHRTEYTLMRTSWFRRWFREFMTSCLLADNATNMPCDEAGAWFEHLVAETRLKRKPSRWLVWFLF